MIDISAARADLSIVNTIHHRVGRKRQEGMREKNGRLSRQLLREVDGHAPAAVARLIEAAVAGYQSKEYGTPLGRLFLEKKLSPAEYEAGRRWDRLMRLYHEAVQAPSPDPRAISISHEGRSAKIDPSSQRGLQEAERHRTIIAAVTAAHAVLISHGKLAERDVRRLCEGMGETPAGHGISAAHQEHFVQPCKILATYKIGSVRMFDTAEHCRTSTRFTLFESLCMMT